MNSRDTQTGRVLLHPGGRFSRPDPVNFDPDDAPLFARYRVHDAPAVTLTPFQGIRVTRRGEAYSGLAIQSFTFFSDHQYAERNRLTYAWRGARAAASRAQSVSGPALWASDIWSGSFYHWLADAAPKLEALHGGCEDHAEAMPPLILPWKFSRRAHVRASLRAWPRIKPLVLPPRPAWLEGPVSVVSPTAGIVGEFNDDLIARVAARLRAAFGANPIARPRRRIFISRSQAASRRIVNEADLVPVLERYGFEIHRFEKLGFEHQVQLMGNAQVVASLHGAGLTNMLFMPRGGLVIELRRAGDTRNNCFYSLAAALGHRYAYHLVDPVSPPTLNRDGGTNLRKDKDRDVAVSPAALDKALSALL